MRMAGASRVALALAEEGWAVAGDGDEVAVGPRGEGAGAPSPRRSRALPVTTPRRQGGRARHRPERCARCTTR